MIIEGVVVAPEGPAVRQTGPPTQPAPDRQPVQKTQEDNQRYRDPFPGSREGNSRASNRALPESRSTLGTEVKAWSSGSASGIVSRSTTKINHLIAS